MATGNIAVDGLEEREDALDTAFDVLANRHRRTIIEELDRDAPLALEELAERIAERDGTTTARSTEIELAHRHLPRLDDADIVDYDPDTRRCELDQAETVRSVLDAIQEAA